MKYGHWECSIGRVTPDTFGFVYCITNKIGGRKYIGCKQIKTVRRSDWKSYTGSNKELNADIEKFGKEHFSFEILALCMDRLSLRYTEGKFIMDTDAIWSDNFYNQLIHLRIRNHKKKNTFSHS